MRKFIVFIVFILTLTSVAAQENKSCCRELKGTDLPRPVTSTYSVEFGGAQAHSLYLSPMTYSGFSPAIAGHWQKAMPFAPMHSLMDFDTRIALFPRLINPGGNALMQGFELEFFWGMGAWWRLPHNLCISVEGGPQLMGGTLLLLRNSNNPVSVNLSAAFAAKAQLSWSGNIKRLPINVSIAARMPLAGAFFMPGYGETFYEILVGNRSGLVHPAWPGNHFRLNMLCAFRMDFGRTAMELGYRLTTEHTHANNLTNRMLTNSFSIGVIQHGL